MYACPAACWRVDGLLTSINQEMSGWTQSSGVQPPSDTAADRQADFVTYRTPGAGEPFLSLLSFFLSFFLSFWGTRSSGWKVLRKTFK
jgi:hypothetical protein